MCGRYTLHLSKDKLLKALAMDIPEDFEYEPDYNIAPGREILAMQENALAPMHWGLRTPHNFHVNARLETADSAPRFRESWEEKRCLIPANGFYEWLNDGVRKQAHYIAPTDETILYFAGLWFLHKGTHLRHTASSLQRTRKHPSKPFITICLSASLQMPKKIGLPIRLQKPTPFNLPTKFPLPPMESAVV